MNLLGDLGMIALHTNPIGFLVLATAVPGALGDFGALAKDPLDTSAVITKAKGTNWT